MTKFRQKGQITLLAVILGVLGLTLGLSVASRSLSDLRQASTVDFGTKALAAAEAAAEYGLSQLATSSDPSALLSSTAECASTTTHGKPSPLTFPGIGIKTLQYKICPGPTAFAQSSGTVPKDDIFQVDLTGQAPTDNIGISWTGASGIEVSVLYQNNRVNRYAFRSGSPTMTNSNFTLASSGSPCVTAAGLNFPSSSNNTGFVIQNQAGVSNPAVLVRVKPVGADGEILVCPRTGTFPAQYYEVIARAETTNGTVKRIKVTRDVSGTLPAIFDNVLYSGGDIIK